MARPVKSVDIMSKNLTKEEYESRKRAEEKLKGGTDKIKPPPHLSRSSKRIFNFIVSQLETSGILTNLDIYILAECSIAIDRIQEAEKLLNKNILDKDALKVKESYMKEFFRCCNELCLSPQSRAKLANINVAAEVNKEDPVLKLLGGDKM